jgi:hypothetical protein
MPVKSEIQLQAECFQWAWKEYPQTRYCLFAVPNGGRRSIMEAMQLKASGVVAGIPDMVLAWKGKAFGFELKIETGRLSKDQIRVHAAWIENGTPVYVCWSFEDFKKKFEEIFLLEQ